MKNGLGYSILTVALAAMLAVGCGKAAEKVAEVATERALESGSGGEANVDISKDGDKVSINVKGEDGKTLSFNADGADGEGGTMTLGGEGESATMAFGNKAKLPDNFPKDIPLYKDFKVLTVTTMPEDKGFVVLGQCSDGVDKVAAFHKKEMAAKGWKEEMAMNQDGMHMNQYTKDGHACNIVVNKGDEGEGTIVNISTQAQ